MLTRGMVEDIGRGVSHKTKAIELYLKNYSLSEIARRMAHSPSSVNRYLESFSVGIPAQGILSALDHQEDNKAIRKAQIGSISFWIGLRPTNLLKKPRRRGHNEWQRCAQA